MGFAVERHNYVRIQDLMAQLSIDMQENGFKVLNVNDTPVTGPTAVIDNTITKILFAATDVVDPIAVEDDNTTHANYALRQPWRVVFEIDHAKQAVRWYVCTPTNIVTDGQSFTVAVSYDRSFGEGATGYRNIRRSGLLTTTSLYQAAKAASPNWPAASDSEFEDTQKYSWRYEHYGYNVIDRMDPESVPMSYRLAITNHGIAFCMWTESRDDEGDKFTWFNVQRMVNKDTGAAIIGNEVSGVEGKAPLFCVFSMIGGGGGASSLDEAGADDAYYFVVREKDVHAPTTPVPASIDTADSNRIINMVQQVSISESNKLVISMMKGLNSQRYAYPHELDMIAYVSADVVSQFADINVRQYGENDDRSFKALKANHLKNKGCRILMIQKGAGIA